MKHQRLNLLFLLWISPYFSFMCILVQFVLLWVEIIGVQWKVITL